MKTSELSGAALDWAVGEALRPLLKTPENMTIATFGPIFGKGHRWPCWGTRKFLPSTDWAHGGPIIEREKIILLPPYHYESFNITWRAGLDYDYEWCMGGEYQGPTALIAAMRCYVASKMGAEVEIPQEFK